MHHRDIGLMAVLLEKHPLQRLGTVPGIAGPKRRAFGEVEQDDAGFRKTAAIRKFQQWHAAIGILRQEIRSAGFTAVKRIVLEGERNT
jgi:hypothetical protein